jgi:ABC-type Na+ transport system ATPase subunit NatA
VNLVLSSHVLPDVEYACDEVIVMDEDASRLRARLPRSSSPAAACSSCA